MFTAVVGDGAFVRAALEALVDFLSRFAAPTGARGSVLFMWGGLIILGFLFLTFLFRSAIVGDLAPVANARARSPRTLLPGSPAPTTEAIALPTRKKRRFEAGREAGRACEGNLDEVLARLHAAGFDARILNSSAQRKRVRAYRCAGCDESGDEAGCDFARGLLTGAFETLTGDLVKVEEVACTREGAQHCDFEVRHAPLAGVMG